MKIIIEKEIDEYDDLIKLSNEEIINIICEDLPKLIDNAEWTIIRKK